MRLWYSANSRSVQLNVTTVGRSAGFLNLKDLRVDKGRRQGHRRPRLHVHAAPGRVALRQQFPVGCPRHRRVAHGALLRQLRQPGGDGQLVPGQGRLAVFDAQLARGQVEALGRAASSM